MWYTNTTLALWPACVDKRSTPALPACSPSDEVRGYNLRPPAGPSRPCWSNTLLFLVFLSSGLTLFGVGGQGVRKLYRTLLIVDVIHSTINFLQGTAPLLPLLSSLLAEYYSAPPPLVAPAQVSGDSGPPGWRRGSPGGSPAVPW